MDRRAGEQSGAMIRSMTSLLAVLASLTIISGALSEIVKIGPCKFVIPPEPCNTTNLQFHLFTRSGPVSGEVVAFGPQSDNLTSSSFHPGSGNKVIIHGFNADFNLFALQDIKNEYLKQGDYNVWMMDWSQLCGGSCYPAALHNVNFAGHCLATAVRRIRAASDSLNLHIIGFSLGAHVPQVAAKLLLPYIIPRVTGLDPAMPGFVFVESRERLSTAAANFVDVIHTNGLLQGLIEPVGHVDFYLNGGINQPGCFQKNVLEWLNCDHVRAPQYFAESINSATGFWGYKCNNDLYYLIGLCRKKGKAPLLMGEHVSNSTRGSFAVETNSESPFAKGKW